MEKEVVKTEKKKKTKVLDIVPTTVGFILLLFTAIGVISKFISKDRLVFGFRSDIVLSESMSKLDNDVKDEYTENGWTNQLKVHDWIFTTKVNEEDLKVGDIVTYNNPIVGTTTHRIVNIKEYSGTKYFTIRADAVPKKDVDGDFKYSDIIGKVTGNAGQFGQVIYFFQTIYGVILLVGLAMICFLYSFLSDRITKKDKNEEQN